VTHLVDVVLPESLTDTGAAAALQLALALAPCASLQQATELTLPLLAAAVGDAPVAVFGVAGSEASGARCWPRDADWSHAFEAELAARWENGPLTELCRVLGVVAPFRIGPLVRQLGWPGLPFRLPGGVLLRDVVCLPVAVVGVAVAAYFVGRSDRDVSGDEVEQLTVLQPVVVAAHGRFLRPTDGTGVVLTPRQQEILRLMERGLTTGSIASRLGISESTVGKHLRDLYARLDTHDRVSTIRQARALGLLDGVAGERWQDVRFR